MRYKVVARLLGLLIVSIALNMIGALIWSIYFSEPVWAYFVLTIVFSSGLGWGLMWLGRHEKHASLSRKEAMLMVGLGWFVAGLG